MSGSRAGFTSSEYPFTSRWMSIRGVSMHYLDEGRGFPVVMLHGNPTWSFFYRNLVRMLSGRYRCVVPDHIGCGLSAKPQRYNYRLKTHVDNCEFLLDFLGIERCHLVVHDWGGAIGMGVAVRNPDRIASMVIMNTAAFRSRRLPWRLAVCKLPVFGEILIRQFNVFVQAARYLATTRRGGLQGEAWRGFSYPYDNFRNRVAVYRFVRDIPLHPFHPSYRTMESIEQQLPLLREIPSLLLWGCRDFVFTTHFLERWQEIFPQAEVLALPAAGHYLLEDEPDRIIGAIRNYFDSEELKQ